MLADGRAVRHGCLDRVHGTPQRHGDAAAPLDELVRAYVQPFYESASHGDAGWRHYAALMGRLSNSPMGTEVIARHYDPIWATGGENYADMPRAATPAD